MKSIRHALDCFVVQRPSAQIVRMPLQSYRELHVWEKAMQLSEACHRVIMLLRPSDRYDIGSQLRRSAASVAANIAEGYGQEHRRQYQYYLGIANGSLNETETHLHLIQRLKLVPPATVDAALTLAGETGKLLTRLRESLKLQA